MSRIKSALAAVGLGGALVLATAATAAPTGTHTADEALKDCPTVLVVGARGSGEKLDEHDSLGATVNAFVTRFRTFMNAQDTSMEVMALVDYPARSVGSIVWGDLVDGRGLERYLAGVDAGVAEGVDKLTSYADVCPDQRIVLAGYSQGAMVMHRVHLGLPDEIRARVAAVALLSDPERAADTGSVLLGAPTARATSQGVYSFTFDDEALDIPDQPFPSTRAWQVCTAGDVICDTRGGTLAHPVRGAAIHTSYAAEPDQFELVQRVAGQAARAIYDPWLISPGRIGVYPVGLKGQVGKRLGLTRPGLSVCGMKWELTSRHVWGEFRPGDPDVLDSARVAGDSPAAKRFTTATGVSIGDEVEDLEASYGDQLTYFEADGEGGRFANYGLFTPDGAIIFVLDVAVTDGEVPTDSTRIWSIGVTGETSVEQFDGLFYGGC